MDLGPLYLQWWHIVLILAGAVVLAWFILGFFTRVTGTWERVDEDAQGVERITLVQFGPFVRGRRMMTGGFQEFTGVLRGRSIAMTRRDHGIQMISNQGFPEEIAEEIEGTVTASMKLTLSAEGTIIHGTFSPQKIEFTTTPAQVTSRHFMDASFRRYRLLSREPIASEVVPSIPDERKS